MIKTYLYVQDENIVLHDFDLMEKESYLRNPNNLLWVDIYDFKEQEVEYMTKIFDFHYLTIEDCIHYSPRAKLDKYEFYDFFVLHALRYDEESEEEIRSEQFNIYLGVNFIVTVHRRTLRTLGRIARLCLNNEFNFMKNGPDFFLYTIIDGLTDAYFPVLERINQRIEELEEEIYEQPSKETTEEFLSLKRTILSMKRAILPQKRIFNVINGHRQFNIREENVPFYLDLVDHIERIVDSIDGFKDLVDGALATYYSIISARTNDTMKILTVISTIFMPLTFVTGFFGMNVPLPAQQHIVSTIGITGGLIATSAIMYFAFKSRKWI